MSDSSLLPEQKELLCGLVEAVERLKPDREPFAYMEDYGDGGALITHAGWQQDSPRPDVRDLDALAEDGYIRRKLLGIGGEFELTAKALALYESLQHQDTENGKASEAGAESRRIEESANNDIYCRAITRESTQHLSRAEYDALQRTRDEYDMFIDGISREATSRKGSGPPQTAKLTSSELYILRDFIESGKPMRPRDTKTGENCLSPVSAIRLFQQARKKVDMKLGRHEYRAFHLHKSSHGPDCNTYEFVPPDDLTYCLIVFP